MNIRHVKAGIKDDSDQLNVRILEEDIPALVRLLIGIPCKWITICEREKPNVK